MDRINQWIDAHADELTKAAARLVRIDSVGAAPAPGKPFGEGVAAAMAEALAIAEEWGFAVRNFDNYVITAQWGEGEPRLGVLCHLDTVPIGSGWTLPPLGAEVREGKLFGRGAIDDKGPAAAALFALRALKECGVPLAAPCRVVLGGDEETGSTDMKYYQTRESFPPCVFSPDGDFPVINTEKGRIQLKVSAPLTDGRVIRMAGGVAPNAVPTEAVALLAGVRPEQIIAGEYPVTAKETAEGLLVTAHGVAAHGSTPHKGVNAVTMLLQTLAASGIGGEAVAAAARFFPHGEFDGAHAGAACSDSQSGPLTLSPDLLKAEEGILTLVSDIRFPVSFTVAGISEALEDTLSPFFRVECLNCVEGHHVPENSPFVQALLRVYEQQTGQPGYGVAIGGGTYVHDIPGGVAFGAEFPGTDHRMHGADEFIGVDELILNAKLMAHAIAAVCG